MIFTETLTHWYSINKRQMPWRLTKNPYKIWLSEIILQQTQINQGLPYYQVFVKEFPTIIDLANAKEEKVLKLWQGLGYYSRARNLHTTARYIAKDLNGNFPDSYTDLLKLKGVGDYTASAIASICFNEPTAVVDGNVYRLLSRYFGVETPINSSKGIKEFKSLAQELIDKSNPGDYNQAVMEFGAVQCKPKNPNCMVCPLQNNCVAYSKNTIDKLPFKLGKLKVKKKYFNYLVFVSGDGNTILEQRKGKGIWQNLYQFPLIETEESITYNDILKEDSFKSIIGKHNSEVSLYNQVDIIHKLSHQHLHTKFWIVSTDIIDAKTIPISEIREYPVPILINNFIEAFKF